MKSTTSSKLTLDDVPTIIGYSPIKDIEKAEKEMGLTPEKFAIITVQVVCNSSERELAPLRSEKDVMGETVYELLQDIKIPEELHVNYARKIFSLETGFFKETDILEDGHFKLSLNDVKNNIKASLDMLNIFLKRELDGEYLTHSVPHRRVLMKMLNDETGLKIYSLDENKAMSWLDWLDWVWFKYKPEHGLSETDVLICKTCNVYTPSKIEEFKIRR